MISSKIDQQIHELVEFVTPDASDFIQSGLKVPSVIRAGRLAVFIENEEMPGQPRLSQFPFLVFRK
jgi:hypothetical protein